MKPNRDPFLRRVAPAIALVVALGTAGCGAERVAQPPAPSETSASPTDAAPTTGATPTTASKTKKYVLTFYGARDNDPPGSTDVAYPDVQTHAGGTGTYANPLTLAVLEGMKGFKPGEKIYIPGLEKYFIYADTCAKSPSAEDGCETQLDAYVGNPSKSEAVLKCEEALTPDFPITIVIHPSSKLPVDPPRLWDDRTQQCGTANW